MNKKNAMGLHVLGELYTKKEGVLIDLSTIKDRTKNSVSKLGLTDVGETSHVFPGGGYTFVVLLAESHISIHTWPEFGYVTIDVFVCNLTENNSDKARRLFNSVVEFFEPDTINKQEIKR